MDIGKAVKTQRIAKGLSVRDLASVTGLSPGSISKIENGINIPNVITMKNIANAMGVAVSYFFLDDEEELVQVVRSDKRDKLLRNNSKSGNVMEEILSKGKDLQMQPCIITFSKGSDSGEAVTHKGEEFVFVLEGKIKFVLEGINEYELYAGDSIYYPCSIPHRWINLCDDIDSRILVVASPASF
jgi:transcriptional regulator with XRE-family HTH domain